MRRKLQVCCITLLLLLLRMEIQAAVNGYTFSSTLSTYTPLTGSTTQILNPSDDNVLSPSQPIGFSFIYDGITYTQFKASSNGFITFNLNQTSSLQTNALVSNVLILAPLWDDLVVDATGKVHYQLTGISPNRVLTIEFNNMRWSGYASSANANFQIKLYEGSNKVEFVYGIFGIPYFATASIGVSDFLANSTTANLNNCHFISVTPGSPSTASSTVENSSISSPPEFGSGTVYTFTPPIPITATLLTIGASGNYTSLQSAFSALRDHGIANAVTLKLLYDYIPETPSNGILIDHIPGTSVINNVTLILDAGLNKTISIPNSSGVDYSIRMRGTKYITIDGSAGTLTIQNTGTNPSSAIKLMDGVQNCIIKNVALQAEGSTSTSANAVINFASSNTNNNINIPNNNNQVLRCTITKATLRCANGVLFSSGSSAPLNDGNRIDSCTITDWGVGTGVAQAGIVLGRGYSNTIIADNLIYMTGAVPSYSTQASLLLGIFSNDASASFLILRNIIYDIRPYSGVTIPTIRGIRVFTSASSPVSLVVNNFVTLDATYTTTLASSGTLYGISDESAGAINYYHNSVRIGGTQSTGSGTSAAFNQSSTGITTLRNNILYNARTNSGSGSGKHYAIRRTSSTGTFSSNNNDLFVSGTGGYVGYTTSDQLTLANWQSATGQDLNSISVNPSYVSALDLHVDSGSLVESGGTLVVTVTTDKDGNTRNSTWPDIGADEFTGSAPGSFVLQTPSNNATTQPVNGTLTWASSPRTGGYDVYLDTSSNPQVLVRSNQFQTSYNYSGLQAGTTYDWRVKARNASGETDPTTSPFRFTTGSVPSAPSNLNVTGLTNNSVTLGWTDNATDETGYRIYRSTNSDGPFAQVGGDQAANIVTYTNSTLTPNTHYYYRVLAFNADGESNFAPRDTTTLANTPNAPTLANVLFSSITVIIDSTNNSSPTQFAIYETSTNQYVQITGQLGVSPAWQTYTQWGRTSGPMVTGLNRTTAYTFSIKARNNNNIETPLGLSASATTLTPISAFPYNIDFEGTFDSDWTTSKNPTAGIPNPTNDWARGTFTKLSHAYSGTKAWVTKLSGTYSGNHLASLVSPEFNFSSFTKAPTISFYHNFKTESYNDAGVFEYTTDGGTTWAKLGIKNDTNGTNWYNNDSTGVSAPIIAPNWSGTSSGWKNATYRPFSLIGKPLVQFRFRFGSDIFNSDSGWTIDKFQITPLINKDIQVVSVSLTQPRMVNNPITVSAKIRNIGTESNPSSVAIAYKPTTPPTSYSDPQGVGETFSPAWDGDSTTVTFTTPYTPTAAGTLKMYVRSFYAGDQNPVNDSTYTSVTVNTEGLYLSEGFENTTFPPPNWSIVDANSDGFTWYRGTSAPYAGVGHATYSYNTNNISIGADDWLFTLPLNLDVTKAYTLSFRYRAKTAAYPEKMEVTIGTGAIPASQSMQLINLPNINNTVYQEASKAFAVPATGIYYIGFHCNSDPYEWDLYLDYVQLKLAQGYDLAMQSLTQYDGTAPTSQITTAKGQVPTIESLSQVERWHLEEIKPSIESAPVFPSTDVNNSIIAVPSGNGVPLSTKEVAQRSIAVEPLATLPSNITIKAAVANIGSNDVTTYGINWSVGGVSQTPYTGGYIPKLSGIDSASLLYAPSARGTYYTKAISVLAQDTNRTNDTATTRTKVYPVVATTLKYDLGTATAQYRIGYDREKGKTLTGGVRFTTNQAIKLANIDVLYTNKNSTGDTYQSQDSVTLRVWAAGVTDSAPGALLYTRRFAGQNYITSNTSGEVFSLPLGNNAPGFVSGTNYWVSVSFDSLIRFPMGADRKSTGRSFISSDKGATWSTLTYDLSEMSWWLRCVSIPLGSISGTKFNDLNDNGVKDTGEPGLQGWTIHISGDFSGSVVTDIDGNYSFTNLEGGTYTITETQQSGWIQTLPPSPGSYTISLTSGAPITGKDFGNFQLGTISGTKYNDLNGDGVKDAGEPGLSGFKIKLFRGSVQVDSILTNGGGSYTFSGVTAGEYTIHEERQNGWIQTYPASQGDHIVSISSGSIITGKDFGNVQTNGIAGIKFHDLNANGKKDSGDVGLANWRIKLYVGEVHVDSTITDSQGAYVFTGLPNATYTVSEQMQSSWLQSYPSSPGTHTVNITDGGSASDINFGNYQLGSISGIKFNDVNGNGIKDAGEAALSGWLVRLSGGKTDSVLTDVNGNYTFNNLIPATYIVSEKLQSGWGQSIPASPGTYTIILKSGNAITGKNFGNYQYSTIAGTKFNDIDGDGIKDAGESGVSGWLIRLSGAKSASTSTDENGNYIFTELPPGSFNISEEIRSGWDQTYPTAPGYHTVEINAGSTITGKDFGNFHLGSISGLKFNDSNLNGIKDAGEAILSNWLIRLSKAGEQVDSIVTDASGNYTFTGLSLGTYTVSEVMQSGWTQSTPPSPGTYTINITSGTTSTGNNFGNYQRATISGTKYRDLNGNGIKEIGESGLSGWRIRLSQNTTTIDSTLTDASGIFTFSNVIPGTYTISESLQTGWVQTYPTSPGTHLVTVLGGGTATGKDFGNFQLGSISGKKYHDINGNGTQDIDEPSLSGWRVRLSKNGVQIDSALTNGGGTYSFSGLSVGTYYVSEQIPTGWSQSVPSGGIHTVVITSGMNATGKDFGNFQFSSISGTKFNDVDGDSVKDTGEPGLSDRRIRLYRNSTLVDSLLSNSDGSYLFQNIIPGTYTVTELMQTGWIRTIPPSPGSYTLIITSGMTVTAMDFGNFQLGSISGTKFRDMNGNGVKESNDSGISNWRIRLSLNGTQIDSVLTNGGGSYSFSGLRAGTYVVSEVMQSGWLQSLPGSPAEYSVPILSGTAATSKDFGNYQNGSISGVAFTDVNGDGIKGTGEPKFSGIKIKFYYNSTHIDSTITDTAGVYSFNNLHPGTYLLKAVVPGGWIQTLPVSPAGDTIQIVSGLPTLNKDFGLFQLGMVRGNKFHDMDGSGVKGTNAGLSNWEIYLFRNGLPVDTVLTSTSGDYEFNGILAGNYGIREKLVSGWKQTYPASPDSYAVSIISGTVDTGKNFGNFQLGIIHGIVFNDLNGNGTKDIDELGLGNWLIKLTRNGVQVDSQLTDGSGNYTFNGLIAGTYTVAEVIPNGWAQGSPPSPGTYTVIITSGTVATNRSFGNFELGSISGVKFNDLNDNGIKDDGEPGLPGWQIRIIGPSETSTLTSEDGSYSFINLLPGTYTVHEVLKAGWIQTLPASPNYYTINVVGGVNSSGKNFGNFLAGIISGTVFEDLNGDTLRNPLEPGVVNWQVVLFRDALHSDTVTTNSAGSYSFTNLSVGTYTVGQIIQPGWVNTYPVGIDTHRVTITSGTVASGKDFGNSKLQGLFGSAYVDVNGNGVRDTLEQVLVGAKIRLTGPRIDSAITDVTGHFAFNNIPAGNYTVKEDIPASWILTWPASPNYYTITLISGISIDGLDFGNFQLATISGMKFNDINGNGVKDVGDTGLVNWRIRLVKSGVPVDSILTDVDGNYTFSGLTVGSYTVSEALQEGWIQTSSPASYTIAVSSGTVSANNDFGNLELLKLHLTSLIEGFYDEYSHTMTPDTVRVELRNTTTPFAKIDQDSIVLNSAGQGFATFRYAVNGTPYYIAIRHRNSIETWSATGQTFTGSSLTYDFTASANKAYGDNMKSKGGKYCAYNGDCTQDGLVDGLDMNDVDNNAASFLYGYYASDMNGDDWTDGLDMNVVDNNSANFIYAITPENSSKALPLALRSKTPEEILKLKKSGQRTISGNDAASYDFILMNDKFVSPNVYEFDVYLKGTNGDTFRVANAQLGLKFNGAMRHGGKLTFSMIDGSSEFALSQVPTSFSVDTVNNILRSAPRANPGIDNGTVVSNVGNGTRLGRFRIINTMPYGSSTVDLVWNFTNTKGQYPSRLSAYVGGVAQEITAPTSYLVNLVNPTLNSSISGLAYNDMNGDGVKDAGEAGLSSWRIRLSKDGSQIDSVFTDASGNYTFTDLTIGTYTVSELLPSGWVQTYPTEPGMHTISLTGGEDITGKDFGNSEAAYTIRYRTFVPESLVALDANGKLPKMKKRKPISGYWEFELTATVPATELHIQFKNDVAFDRGIVAEPFTTISGDTKKKFDFSGGSVDAGQTIIVKGYSRKGVPQQIKKAYFGSTEPVPNPAVNMPQTRGYLELPMPTYANFIDEVFQANFKSGLVIGTPGDRKQVGWVNIKKSANIQKSLRTKSELHTGDPRYFDQFTNGKSILGEQKMLAPTKHNNRLFAEIIALKLAIGASASSHVESGPGFGELVYTNPGNVLDNMMVRAIADSASAFMTSGTGGDVAANNYYNVIRSINLAFSGELDTVSFGVNNKTVLSGVRRLSEVSILHSNPEATYAVVVPGEYVSEIPDEFELGQNYPNPFNPTTTIEFVLPQDALVTLKVYNILGEEVGVLADRELYTEGINEVDFDASGLPSGIYFYRIVAEGMNDDGENTIFTKVNKMILMK